MTENLAPTNELRTSDTGDSTRNTRKNRKIAIVTLTIIFVTLGLIWLLYYLIWSRFEVYTDDAYVNGNLVSVMSQVPGTVIAINTDDTYLVNQGQKIIQLDGADTTIVLEKAKANLAETVRQVRQAYEFAQQSQAALTLQRADLIKAQLDLKRRIGLVGEKAISHEELQHYQTTLDAAKAKYDYTLHQYNSALAIVENSQLYTHPKVQRAKENLRTAYLNSIRTNILAPITGYIAKRSVQVGQQITPNTPLLAIVPLQEVWVDANYKESQLKNIRIGQPVTLYSDAFSGVTYHGKVVGLNAGTGAAFSLLPPQNATGNWIKIVQRLPVRVSIDADDLKKHPLLLGLSMHSTINVHGEEGKRLAVTASKKTIYTTDVYAKQLADADQLINAILVENSPNISLPESMQIKK